eukprot:TRINITY_DN12358_c1_g2_i6.p1 TRINITY_DN12358_c1_g2~~TRINITY_DN12358_c1_g2_i6.p1  ORF type:complete len:151 (+),score=5.46 TRINITY_DN12358_c1_g2_i6:27-479(+)
MSLALDSTTMPFESVTIQNVSLLTNDDVAYLILTSGNSGAFYSVHRTYDDFFKLHCDLLDTFPLESGFQTEPRTLPPLPGKKLVSLRPTKAARRKAALQLAQRRQQPLCDYLAALIRLPSIIKYRSAAHLACQNVITLACASDTSLLSTF